MSELLDFIERVTTAHGLGFVEAVVHGTVVTISAVDALAKVDNAGTCEQIAQHILRHGHAYFPQGAMAREVYVFRATAAQAAKQYNPRRYTHAGPEALTELGAEVKGLLER